MEKLMGNQMGMLIVSIKVYVQDATTWKQLLHLRMLGDVVPNLYLHAGCILYVFF